MLSIFFFLSSSVRFTRKQEKMVNYTSLSKTEVNTWIAKNPNCVVVYSDSPKTMKPLKMAIDDNSDFVSFALADPNPETNQYCIAYPCASAYLKGRHVRSTVSDFSPIDFQFWVTHTISEPHFDIVHPEELRRLLRLPGNHLLAVNVDKRPSWVPKDQVLFHVQKHHMKKFGLETDDGIYLYRAVDRQIFHIDSWDSSLFKTNLFELGVDNLQTKEYLAIALIDHFTEETDAEKFFVMNDAAESEFGKRVHFATAADSNAGHIAQASKFQSICGPTFVMLKTKNLTGEHWGIVFEESYNFSSIKGFIRDVLDGKQKPVIYEDTPKFNEDGVALLNALDYEERVFSNDHTSIVFIDSSCEAIDDTANVIMNIGQKYYHGKGVEFYHFDQGHNDNPSCLKPFENYPTIIAYAKGSKEQKLFAKTMTLPNIEKFINQNSGVTLLKEEKEKFQNEVLLKLNSLNEDSEYVYDDYKDNL